MTRLAVFGGPVRQSTPCPRRWATLPATTSARATSTPRPFWGRRQGDPAYAGTAHRTGGRRQRRCCSAGCRCGKPRAQLSLIHDALIHGDVMGGDHTRRHRPTAWSLFGEGSAILAGDALLTLAYDVLAAGQYPEAPNGTRMLSAAVLGMIEGQSIDLAFGRRTDVDLRCLLLGGAFREGNVEQVDDLRASGEHLGLAFQHVDYLLGIWRDPDATGKPIHSDRAQPRCRWSPPCTREPRPVGDWPSSTSGTSPCRTPIWSSPPTSSTSLAGGAWSGCQGIASWIKRCVTSEPLGRSGSCRRTGESGAARHSAEPEP